MRIYSSLKEAYNEIQRDLVEMGVEVHPQTMQDKIVKDDKDYLTKEMVGYCYSINDFSKIREDFEFLGGNEPYAFQEVLDRTASDLRNPGSSWKHRSEIWEEFLHDGKFSYTYNERFRDQLPSIIYELTFRPNTRQAIITMYDKHLDLGNIGGKARIPCSLSYQYLIRPNGNGVPCLDLIYTMRSCDIFTHLIYDQYINMKVQEYVAHAIGIEPGRFIHFTGSLHGYYKDYSKKGIF